MNILIEARNEDKRLRNEINSFQKKLDALQSIFQAYPEEFSHSTVKLNNLVIDCLKANEGHAEYGEIVDFLTKHDIFLPKQRISLALTKNKDIAYNRNRAQWEIVAMPHL
jgi:hypothetical protein